MFFLFLNYSRELSKFSKIIICITLLTLAVASYNFFEYISGLNINKSIDFIVSKYLLIMEVDGYLSENNENKMIQELESIGVKNIDIEETTRQKTENNIVTLSVKVNYKSKAINREKTSRYCSLD